MSYKVGQEIPDSYVIQITILTDLKAATDFYFGACLNSDVGHVYVAGSVDSFEIIFTD